jgi:hypothetical protein
MELTPAAAKGWRPATRLMGGGGDLATAWNEAERAKKDGGRVGEESVRDSDVVQF